MKNADYKCQAPKPMHLGMSPRQIKAELILRDVSIKEIAIAAGVTSGAVTQTIHQYNGKRFKGYRIREIIAQALGRTVEEIWPDQKEAI